MRRLLLSLLSITVSAFAINAVPKDQKLLDGKVQEAYMQMSERADSLMQAAEWSEAEELIISTLRNHPANPGNAMLFSNLGVCKRNIGKLEEALECFELALIKAPLSTVVLSNRATTYLMLDRKNEALSDLDTALETDSTLTDLRFLRGMLSLDMRNYNKADSDFRILTSDIPQDLMVKYPESSDKINRTDPEVRRYYATLLTGAARVAEALTHHTRASKLYSNALSLDMENDEAIEAVVHFLKHDPEEYTQSVINQLITKLPTEGRLYLCMAALCKKRFLATECEINKKIAKHYGVDSQTIDFFLKNF